MDPSPAISRLALYGACIGHTAGGLTPFFYLYCRYARGRVTTAYIAKLMSSCFHLTAMWRAVRTATQSPTGNILFGPTPSSLSFCCCSLQSTGNVCPNQRSVQIASESNKSSALSSICVNIAFVCVCYCVCVCVCACIEGYNPL